MCMHFTKKGQHGPPAACYFAALLWMRDPYAMYINARKKTKIKPLDRRIVTANK